MSRKTLAAARGWATTFGSHYGYATHAKGLHGYSPDGASYFKGEGDFIFGQAAPKLPIPRATRDPSGNWALNDPRPEIYEFARALRNGLRPLSLDETARGNVALKIRSYYDRLPEGLVHPSQIAAIARAVEDFILSD